MKEFLSSNIEIRKFVAFHNNIELINEIKDIEKVEPMTHCLDDFEYELREDIPEESCTLDEILSNIKKNQIEIKGS